MDTDSVSELWQQGKGMVRHINKKNNENEEVRTDEESFDTLEDKDYRKTHICRK